MLSLPPLALYIHIPWCVKKCPYCDFNSHGLKAALPQTDYVAALLRDLEQDLPLVWGRPVTSIFFGGGTPSLFDAAHIGQIIDGVSARLPLRPGLEVTLETNPGTVEHDRFEAYREAGINRISFGVQSFDDGCLRRLGRIHDAQQAVQAIELAKRAGFDNFNLDLMYALPEQSLDGALDDVARAIELAPSHISHYQLTLEPNTVFHARPPSGIPEDDDAWDMQEACQAKLAEAGYGQYEVSAYAKPGRQCAHNLNYWRFGDYLGIGAGAHGKITLPANDGMLRRWKLKHPQPFMSAAGSPAAIGGDEWIETAQRPFEFMLNALRLNEGFALTTFEARTGLPRSSIDDALNQAVERGWLQIETRQTKTDQIDDGEIPSDQIRTTALGQRFLNEVIALFMV